jgi:hypothetical protein
MSRYDSDTTHPAIEALAKAVAAARNKVVSHSLYSALDTHAAITTFMEHHVFAVWDFMSLLKSLQRQLTCVDVPWIPSGPVGSRRLINDIVLVEESDELRGGYTSHFELYVNGMAQAGADHTVINQFIDQLRANHPVPAALASSGVPEPSAKFVTTTWSFIENAPVHCQAAVFAFGREDLIPDMFTQVVAVNTESGGLDTFLDYLQRHIEVDGEEHTPMAMQMLVDLCGDDDQKWEDCVTAVNAALTARAQLWDGIYLAIAARYSKKFATIPSYT